MLLQFAFACDDAVRGYQMKGYSPGSYQPFIYFLPIFVMFQVNYLAAKLTRHQKNNHMTELNLFLRFIAPANAGCSAYSKVCSTPEFLNPKETILFAAFLSLSCVLLLISWRFAYCNGFNITFELSVQNTFDWLFELW